jgi:hypothetical protein
MITHFSSGRKICDLLFVKNVEVNGTNNHNFCWMEDGEKKVGTFLNTTHHDYFRQHRKKLSASDASTSLQHSVLVTMKRN